MRHVQRDISKEAAQPRKLAGLWKGRHPGGLRFGLMNGRKNPRRNSLRKRPERVRSGRNTFCSGKGIISTTRKLLRERRSPPRFPSRLRHPAAPRIPGNDCQGTGTFVIMRSMKSLFSLVMAALLLSFAGAQAQGPDDQYVRIYNLIQEGDSLAKSSQPSPALAKYLEAQTALQRFQKGYPDWNTKVVSFRLNYLAEKIAAASPRYAAPGATVPARPALGLNATFALTPRAPGTNGLDSQLSFLKDQVRQLQNDNLLLESKLKESFSAQPAAMDPRELAKAQGKVQSLQKENELLKFTLTQEKAKSSRTVDPKAVEQTQQFLNEANRKLADQIERANRLALEKTALQNKLASMGPGSLNSNALAATKKSLEEANARLAQQSALAEKLTSEKEALMAQLKIASAGGEEAAAANAKLAQQSALSAKLAGEKEALLAQVKALSAAGGEAAALPAENELLSKQLAELTASSS